MAFSEELTLDDFDPPPVPNSSGALLVTLRSEEMVVREGSGTSMISSMTSSHWLLGRFEFNVDDSSSSSVWTAMRNGSSGGKFEAWSLSF